MTQNFREAYEHFESLRVALGPDLTRIVRNVVANHDGTPISSTIRRAALEPLFAFHQALGEELKAAKTALNFDESQVS